MDDSTLVARTQRGPVKRVLVVVLDTNIATHDLPASGEVILGRGEGAGIRVDHRSVSRAHAAIEVGEAVRVRDLGSANGTSLRGARLPANRAVEIGANEAFQVGDATVVVHERRTGTRPTSPPPAGGDAGVAIAPLVVDPAMRNLFDLARRVAAGTINVLVVGESGAGKEVLVREIHAASRRAAGPLVAINCAAISETLIESELFGHERGAFTGAGTAKAGLVEVAAGGTAFLDEVGELSPAAQAKLLRVIEDRRVLRVGAVEARPVDVRFVAATNRNLEEAAAAGEFREDLYFRLAGVVLEVPPLRERRADIEPLARAFAAAAAAQQGRELPELTAEAVAALLAHPWPGNVRELRNVVERAVLLCGDRIAPADLFRTRGATAAPAPPARAATDGERTRIVAALEQCAGNQTRAAELLGIPLRTFVKRLAQYDIPRPKRR
ncbi:MAG: sigma 54-interacting transcriptional regulator [Deltaproteobacteria bacterium]|nr:sigma 54-interacting transcriptional regulator [Deltaproteobacteria bacterium]